MNSVAGWWFSPVSSTNKTDRNDTTQILLKVALNTISLNPIRIHCFQLMIEKNTLDYTNIIIFQHIFEFFRSLLFYWGVWNANGRAEVPSM